MLQGDLAFTAAVVVTPPRADLIIFITDRTIILPNPPKLGHPSHTPVLSSKESVEVVWLSMRKMPNYLKENL